MTEQINPRLAALLVMDYQNGVVDMLGEPDELLSLAADAIATMRSAGGHVGYVRVAFEDADLDAQLRECSVPRQADVITVADLDALLS